MFKNRIKKGGLFKAAAAFIAMVTVVIFVSVTGCAGGCSGKKPKTNFTEYKIEAGYDGEFITATESVSFFNDTEEGINELKFNLYPNAFRKDAKYTPVTVEQRPLCYYKGLSYGYISVFAVFVNGEEADFCIEGKDENILTVPLFNTVFPSETVEVTINFKVKLAEVVARTGITEKTVNIANWYPVLCVYDNGFCECEYYSTGDPFYSECADYEVYFTVKNTYAVASSGVTVSSKSDHDKITYGFKAQRTRDFAIVMSEEFDCLTETESGVEINYYFYKDTSPEKTLKTAKAAIKTFSELFGKYPYKKYDVAETQIFAGGMEYPCLSMIDDNLTEEEREEVVIHETAHQWWYSVVGNDEISYGFLDEGLTEYSVILFYEKNPSYNKNRTDFIKKAMKSYSSYCTVYDKLYGKKDTSMIRKLSEFSSDYEYVNIAYMKGALMHEYLRNAVGEEKFFKGLKKYYSDNMYKTVTPYDYVSVYESLGCRVENFFESWFDGDVIL